VVVVPLALHWENRLRLVKFKEGSTHKRRQNTQELYGYSDAFRKSSRNSGIATSGEPLIQTLRPVPRLLLASRSPSRTESFRRIKKALMPQSCVRQLPRLPLLKRLVRGGEHPAIDRIEDHDHPG
jgi:hypothetical protein